MMVVAVMGGGGGGLCVLVRPVFRGGGGGLSRRSVGRRERYPDNIYLPSTDCLPYVREKLNLDFYFGERRLLF